MDSFLAIAEDLQLKGLTGQERGNGNVEKGTILPNDLVNGEESTKSTCFDQPRLDDQMPEKEDDKASRSVGLTTILPAELQKLQEKVAGMLEKTLNVTANGKKMFACKVCRKEGECMNMKRHIEANHLEGISISCNLCEKTTRSRHALSMHMRNNHTTCTDGQIETRWKTRGNE